MKNSKAMVRSMVFQDEQRPGNSISKERKTPSLNCVQDGKAGSISTVRSPGGCAWDKGKDIVKC